MQLVMTKQEISLVAENEEEGIILRGYWVNGVHRQAFQPWNGTYANLILSDVHTESTSRS